MPTEGKESFNPVGKHSQLYILCGNRAETLRKFKTNLKLASLDRQPKGPNLALFLVRGARLKSEACIAPTQPLALPKANLFEEPGFRGGILLCRGKTGSFTRAA